MPMHIIVYEYTMHMCKISHDIGRLKIIRMPLLRLEDVNMILQCPITEGPPLCHM